MTKINDTIILEKAAQLFARSGYEDFSIRKLAKNIPITPSVIYHYFKDEHTLLRKMFDYLNTNLGKKRAELPQPKTAAEMLKQRIEFQLDNADAIVAVLKYYLAFRDTFPKFKEGFVPDKSSLHIEEVLHYGLKRKEFKITNLEDDTQARRQRLQADFIVRQCKTAFQNGIGMFICYNWGDDGANPNQSWCNFGVVEEDRKTIKPAYTAIQKAYQYWKANGTPK